MYIFLCVNILFHVIMCFSYNNHIIQQMRAPSLARNTSERRQATTGTWRLQAPTKQGLHHTPTAPLVRALLGSPWMQVRRLRPGPLRHRGLRRIALLQRHRRQPAGHPRRNHAGAAAGLLRREPGRRVQHRNVDFAHQRHREMQLRWVCE